MDYLVINKIDENEKRDVKRNWFTARSHFPITVKAISKSKPNSLQLITYDTFGRSEDDDDVYNVHVHGINEKLIMKKELLNKVSYLSPELRMLRKLNHPNVLELLYFFYSVAEEEEKVYLHLMMEDIHFTLTNVISNFHSSSEQFSVLKLCLYQMFRGLAYLHSLGICHRHICPNTIRVNDETGVLKITGFEKAIHIDVPQSHFLDRWTPSYTAPEVLLRAHKYTVAIDVWSTGCILLQAFTENDFSAQNTVEEFVNIMMLLGPPTEQDFRDMNVGCFKYPQPQRLELQCLPCVPQTGMQLLTSILRYSPSERLTALEVLSHPFFEEMRNPVPPTPTASEDKEGLDLTKMFASFKSGNF